MCKPLQLGLLPKMPVAKTLPQKGGYVRYIPTFKKPA